MLANRIIFLKYNQLLLLILILLHSYLIFWEFNTQMVLYLYHFYSSTSPISPNFLSNYWPLLNYSCYIYTHIYIYKLLSSFSPAYMYIYLELTTWNWIAYGRLRLLQRRILSILSMTIALWDFLSALPCQLVFIGESYLGHHMIEIHAYSFPTWILDTISK